MTTNMRTLRFHEYGEPAEVLKLETADVPEPTEGKIRIAVYGTGVAPADWALCRGLFAGTLPRGVGIDVSGTVDAVGAGVTDVKVGDRVLGSADWRAEASAGASDFAIMNRWTPAPDGTDMTMAAGMTMAVDTAYGHLTALGLDAGRTILINGAGSTIGYAAVQIALVRGLTVIATAGVTYADRLQKLGAKVTSYGDGMVERVLELNGGPLELVLNTSPGAGALPQLIEVAGEDPKRVVSISDFAAAQELGVRSSVTEDLTGIPDPLPEFAALAAEGKFTIPVAGTYPLAAWPEALAISLGGAARGKLVLIP